MKNQIVKFHSESGEFLANITFSIFSPLRKDYSPPCPAWGAPLRLIIFIIPPSFSSTSEVDIFELFLVFKSLFFAYKYLPSKLNKEIEIWGKI